MKQPNNIFSYCEIDYSHSSDAPSPLYKRHEVTRVYLPSNALEKFWVWIKGDPYKLVNYWNTFANWKYYI